ncbi:MAG: hypothetical protein GEU94_13385, partial [Micromonosporaceae bacterium]|nr:hypothetical protein [Micromonosporaceae bacterium]
VPPAEVVAGDLPHRVGQRVDRRPERRLDQFPAVGEHLRDGARLRRPGTPRSSRPVRSSGPVRSSCPVRSSGPVRHRRCHRLCDSHAPPLVSGPARRVAFSRLRGLLKRRDVDTVAMGGQGLLSDRVRRAPAHPGRSAPGPPPSSTR